MTRVIHTGDTHIGYRQYHSPERRRDFLAAFEQVVDDAVEADVDAVIHAGDLFHNRRPELRDLLDTLAALRRLSSAGVPFLAVVGNHESTRDGQWLDLFERLGLAARLGSEPRVLGDTAFYGLDHVPRSRRDELDYDFGPHDAEHAALVGHGLFTPFAHADWDTETVLEAASVEFDAMLLGDNHTADAAEVEGTWVTYCGSTERASAAERSARGYNLVTFGTDAGEAVDVRRRSLDTRPFVFVTVELGPDEGVERVREQVRQHDLDDAVVVVDIEGEGAPVTPASVEEFALDAGALVARVNDRRETESEHELAVSFADPDRAVERRVEELGLSEAALDIDEAVRGPVADSNVRETVRSRVAERVADDLGTFDPASDAGDDTGSEADDATDGPGEPTAERSPGGDEDGTTDRDRSGAAADVPADVDSPSNDDDTPPDDADSPPTVDDADSSADDTDSPPVDDDPDPVDEGTNATADGDAAGDSPSEGADEPRDDRSGQVSMEDFL